VSEVRAKILLIEDDVHISRFVHTTLASQNFEVRDTVNGTDGLAEAVRWRPDLLILDLGLPDMDGVEVVRKLRDWSSMPIVVLSARNLEESKIATLDAGADDYLTKPFSVGELMARIRVALRRGSSRPDNGGDFTLQGLKVDLAHRRVFCDGQEVHLTPIEYRLLTVMIRNTGRVMTHKQLLREVWGPEHSEDNHYVRIYMAQLRHKLEKDPAQPRYLLTETGVGYRLADS
jgi:two-component system, OmpR family, KDP operon response regulator KdpE